MNTSLQIAEDWESMASTKDADAVSIFDLGDVQHTEALDAFTSANPCVLLHRPEKHIPFWCSVGSSGHHAAADAASPPCTSPRSKEPEVRNPRSQQLDNVWVRQLLQNMNLVVWLLRGCSLPQQVLRGRHVDALPGVAYVICRTAKLVHFAEGAGPLRTRSDTLGRASAR